MNPLSTLVKENLIEIGRGQMAAFAEDFPQPPFLHSDTLVPGPLAESGRYSQAEGVLPVQSSTIRGSVRTHVSLSTRQRPSSSPSNSHSVEDQEALRATCLVFAAIDLMCRSKYHPRNSRQKCGRVRFRDDEASGLFLFIDGHCCSLRHRISACSTGAD